MNPQEEEVTAKKTILGRFKGLNPFKGKEKSQAQIDEKKELETFQKEIEPAKLESNGNKKEVSPFKNGKFAKNESVITFYSKIMNLFMNFFIIYFIYFV